MKLQGLTPTQVAAKISAGKVNKLPKSATGRTIPQIILHSTLTIFNLVNLVLAALIILVGSYKNLLFIFIAIANTAISIVNEIRAKRTIDKLKLQAEQKPTVIRGGQTLQIPASQIVEGDLMLLSLGDQILVDSTVTQGQIEVNESYVTGEQDNVAKKTGDQLTSGSFVVSGTCYATVTSVGAQNFLAKLESSAKSIKPSRSKLFTIMNNIVKYISFALIPIGILLLWRQLATQGALTEFTSVNSFASLHTALTSESVETAVTGTVAALINMIPEGLILLTSSVLALATIRLSRRNVLVQDLYSIETLARVDTICLDKTGTLTTGHLRVKELIPGPNQTKNTLQNAFMAILSHVTADNATSTALRKKLARVGKYEPTDDVIEVIPFSSERKYSGIRTKNREILMGALEFITGSPTIHAEAKALLQEVAHPENYRIISVIERQHPNSALNSAPSTKIVDTSTISKTSAQNSSETLLGFALLEDEIRPDAPEIIKYFTENDVAVKIISGDNLATVQTIARKVGVPGSAQGIDFSTVGSHPSYTQLVQNYQIFARVTPSQKKHLIRALRQQKHTVAMTGDGVNDILAMKEADCSIAIGAGADAARRAARLVLLDSDFASVPSIIAEGRQTINNLERSTTLFLSKTIYASILAVLFTILPLEYPYAPIEMSLLNVLCIGLPGLALALEKNTARVKDQFVANIKKYSLPTGLTVAAAMLILATLDKILPQLVPGFSLARPDLLLISMIITFIIGTSLIYRISRPLNRFRTALLALIVATFIIIVLIPPLRLLLTG